MTVVAVEVAGASVRNGSTIAATGEMLVTSNRRTRVVVNGVTWVPVSSDGNTDSYHLTTGGRVMVFSANDLLFSFYNDFTPDFDIFHSRTEVSFLGTPEGSMQRTADGTFVQWQFPATFSRVSVSVRPSSIGDIDGLVPSVSQESATGTLTIYGSVAQIEVTGAVKSKPLEVYLGNVLLAYLAAAE